MYRALLRTLGFLAHAISFVLAGVFVIFFLGELFVPHSGPPVTLREWLGIVLITVACCAPVFALHHELRTATVSLAALAGFWVLVDFEKWPVAAVLALPGALHLIHALMERPGHTMHTAT